MDLLTIEILPHKELFTFRKAMTVLEAESGRKQETWHRPGLLCQSPYLTSYTLFHFGYYNVVTKME
jgi:hypothetical protein